jgi:hypothetical protein
VLHAAGGAINGGMRAPSGVLRKAMAAWRHIAAYQVAAAAAWRGGMAEKATDRHGGSAGGVGMAGAAGGIGGWAGAASRSGCWHQQAAA